jgi:hypothetical protein
MKNLFRRFLYLFYWEYWLFTGYRELTALIRSHSGNFDALTPVGLERMKELGEHEAHLIRVLKGIEKV